MKTTINKTIFSAVLTVGIIGSLFLSLPRICYSFLGVFSPWWRYNDSVCKLEAAVRSSTIGNGEKTIDEAIIAEASSFGVAIEEYPRQDVWIVEQDERKKSYNIRCYLFGKKKKYRKLCFEVNHFGEISVSDEETRKILGLACKGE